MTFDTLLTVTESAAFLGTSRQTVRKLIRNRQLHSVRLGKEWRVPQAKLLTFVETGGTEPCGVASAISPSQSGSTAAPDPDQALTAGDLVLTTLGARPPDLTASEALILNQIVAHEACVALDGHPGDLRAGSYSPELLLLLVKKAAVRVFNGNSELPPEAAHAYVAAAFCAGARVN